MTKKELEDKMEEELRGLYDRLDIIEMEYENERGEIEEEIEERKGRVIKEYSSQFKVGDVVYGESGRKYEVRELSVNGEHIKVRAIQKIRGEEIPAIYEYWKDTEFFKREGEK